MSEFDFIIKNGTVIDGAGGPRFPADVYVTGDRITYIGPPTSDKAGRVIDATGLIVAPGFIDMMGQSEYHLLIDPRGMSKIMQGVTTEITCEGTSVAPMNDRSDSKPREYLSSFGLELDWTTLPQYFARLERQGIGLNIGTYVGATQLRSFVIGVEDRPPTATELGEMQRLAVEAMDSGAFGLSSALQYVPAYFAQTDELVALAQAVASRGGIYATHQRSEGDRLTESLTEVFAIARLARISVEIFHLKAAYPRNWGTMPAIIERINQAREEGLDITADVYPYTAASTALTACLPPWARAGGINAMLARLGQVETRAQIKQAIQTGDGGWDNLFLGSGGAAGIQICAVGEPSLLPQVGKRLDAIASEQGSDALEVLLDMLLADRGRTDALFFVMSEEDLRAALAAPFTSICTDSSARAIDGPLSSAIGHPRGWGAFPRVLSRYVRDEQLFDLETAVHKMTGLPAACLGLSERGILRAGNFADLVLFDQGTVRDRATYEESRQYPSGISYVFVNGQLVVDQGQHTGRLAGRPLLKLAALIDLLTPPTLAEKIHSETSLSPRCSALKP
jgi:N-acyl-D-amino-acid deacylase